MLKNDCQVSEIDEEQVEYAQRRRRKEIEIERLREQLKSRKPKGRDLTREKWLTTLEEATNQVPLDEFEPKSWQASLLKATSNIPYPVDYETNTDLDWLIHSADDEMKRRIILVWQIYFFNQLIKSGLYSFIKYLYFQRVWLPRRDVNWLNLKNKPGRIFVKFNGLKRMYRWVERIKLLPISTITQFQQPFLLGVG